MLKKENLLVGGVKHLIGLISPKLLASLYYYKATGKIMDWSNPKDLNEKILWLSLCSDTSEWTDLADKYKVREFIERKGYGDLLTKLYGVWENANEIDYKTLPNHFVLKTNHGSGTNIIVKDKSKLNIKATNEQLNKWLKMKFGWPVEPHYLRIKPLIIAEEFLEDKENVFSSSLVDYKVYCMNGKPEIIRVYHNRTKNSVFVETFDLEWNYHPETSVFSRQYQDGGGKTHRPYNLHRMIDIARNLSSDFPQLRVDFYEVNKKLYFGEMTFTSNQGTITSFTNDFLMELGQKVILPI